MTSEQILEVKRWLPAVFLGIVATLPSCGGSTEPKCAVTGVTVAPNAVTITVGQTFPLNATYSWSHCASAPGLTWVSGNTAFVTVQPNGTTGSITGVSPTASPVSVTVSSGGVSAASQVTVIIPPPRITLTASTLNFSATTGGANPASQLSNITNGGGGTLSGLSFGTITYGAGATGWLQTPVLSGTTAPATLTIQPVTGALTPAMYSATIPVLSGVATNSPQTLTVNFTVAAATQVALFVGNNQTGLVGFALNVRPAVRVTTVAGGTPVAGVGVTFAAATGGGSVVGGATVNTNANGVAQVGGWVLGAAPGANTLTATAAGTGVAGNPVTFNATGAPPAFNIIIQNVGPAFTPDVQAAFDAAVAKWQQIIYQDIPDVPGFTAPANTCPLSGSPAIGPVNVDDVLILANIAPIDGVGGILGQSGPCYIRNGDGLTIMGHMTFDVADIANLSAAGSLNSVILHEMGHVLGFGTLWSQPQFNCLQNLSAPPGTINDTYFSCPNARSMFDSLGGTSYTGGMKVPVENCGPTSPVGCGAGTVNSHWREPTFGNELMTGYLNNGSNPLSALSAAAMQDLGYGVNYAGADAYNHVFMLTLGPSPASVLVLGNDVYRGPIYVVDKQGRIVSVIQPR